MLLNLSSILPIILITAIFFLIKKFSTRNFDYWEKRKVTYIDPIPFFGNFLEITLFRSTLGEYLAKLYNSTKEPFFGIFVFNTPHLIIRSPELVKTILVRDFHNFDDRTIAKSHDEMVNSALFLDKNPRWKATRTKLTPVFTTGKLKSMVPLINQVGEELQKYVEKNIPNFSMDAKEVSSKFSTDVIAKCAFGINAHCFDSDDAEFRKMGRLIFDFRWLTAIRQTSYFFLPWLVSLLHLEFIDRKVTAFMRSVFSTSIQQRVKQHQKSGDGKKINDLIDIIIEMKGNKKFLDEVDFTGDTMISPAFQFFVAGFETTSATMAFTLHELCIHPHIQNKLRNEITSCLKQTGGEITYEMVQNMKYLHMCVSETLRKYPVLPFLDRRCRNDYKIPGSDVVIEKGTPVYIPMFGLHYDEEYFPNPHKYNPERFSDNNLEHLTPFSYIPFGEGPRNCIGERFGMLGTKMGLIHILSQYEVEKSNDTPIPLQFEPRSFVLASKVGLPMKFRKCTTLAA